VFDFFVVFVDIFLSFNKKKKETELKMASSSYKDFIKDHFKKRPAGTSAKEWMKKGGSEWKKLKTMKGGALPPYNPFNPYVPKPSPYIPPIPGPVIVDGIPRTMSAGSAYTDWESQFLSDNEDDLVGFVDQYGRYVPTSVLPDPVSQSVSLLKTFPRQIIRGKKAFNRLLDAGTFF